MKKFVLVLGVLCFLLTSCNCNKKKTEQATESCCKTEKKCAISDELKAQKEEITTQLGDWANLADETKVALVAKAKAFFDEIETAMKADTTKKCCKKEVEGLTEEAIAKCKEEKAAFEAKWDEFSTLTLEEQKDLIMKRFECCKPHCEKSCEKHVK